MLVGIVGAIVSSVAEQSLLISIGIRALKIFRIISFGIIGAGGLSLAGGSGYSIKKSLDAKKHQQLLLEEKEKKQIANYSQNIGDPDNIRKKLLTFEYSSPDIVHRCISQMDRMDSYQERQRTLINENAAVYLEDTVQVLSNSEERICKTIRTIINYLVVVESERGNMSPFDAEIINVLIDANEQELQSVSELLRYSVNYINNYEQDGTRDRSELDSWLETMGKRMQKPNTDSPDNPVVGLILD